MITNTGEIYSKNIINEDNIQSTNIQSNNLNTDFIQIIDKTNINNNNSLSNKSILINGEDTSNIKNRTEINDGFLKIIKNLNEYTEQQENYSNRTIIDGGEITIRHKYQGNYPTITTIQGGNITGNVIEGTQFISKDNDDNNKLSIFGPKLIIQTNETTGENKGILEVLQYNTSDPSSINKGVRLNAISGQFEEYVGGNWIKYTGGGSDVGQFYPNSTYGEIFNCYEGNDKNIAVGNYSHAEGYKTKASGSQSHAEGNGTNAEGNCSHAGGIGTYTYTEAGTVIGKYNIYQQTNNSNIDNHLFVIGNGSDTSHRSNAFVVDNNGNVDVSGNINVNGQLKLGGFTISVSDNTLTIQ